MPTTTQNVSDDPFIDVMNEAPATSSETREHYLKRARRGYAVIRRSFLRMGSDSPGPMATLVQARSLPALRLYLLRLSLQPVKGVEAIDRRTLARMLSEDGGKKVTEETVGRSWGLLRERQLVTGGSGRIELLREDGSGESYTAPRGQYFTLPFNFWLSDDGEPCPADLLGIPGIAMLLVLLAETQGRMSQEVTAAWVARAYGFSQSTIDRGYSEISRAKLMDTRTVNKKGPEYPSGYRKQVWRALTGPFSMAHRDQLRAKARKGRTQKGGEKADDVES